MNKPSCIASIIVITLLYSSIDIFLTVLTGTNGYFSSSAERINHIEMISFYQILKSLAIGASLGFFIHLLNFASDRSDIKFGTILISFCGMFWIVAVSMELSIFGFLLNDTYKPIGFETVKFILSIPFWFFIIPFFMYIDRTLYYSIAESDNDMMPKELPEIYMGLFKGE